MQLGQNEALQLPTMPTIYLWPKAILKQLPCVLPTSTLVVYRARIHMYPIHFLQLCKLEQWAIHKCIPNFIVCVGPDCGP